MTTSSSTPKLSIVIVNYNTAPFLEACLSSIPRAAPDGLWLEVTVVDNASSDGSERLVRERFPWVTLLTNESNVGFSAANNNGVRHSTGRYVLFLNPDVVVHAGALDTMLAFMERVPEACAATCQVLLPDGRPDDGAHRGFPTPWNAFCYFSGLSRLLPRSRLIGGYTLGWLDRSTVHEIDALVGAFMLVRREAGEAVGWWDEDFFFYGEDLDFCYRLKKAGWKVFYVPDATITHVKSAASGIKKSPPRPSTASLDTRLHASRARFEAMRLFYRKHYLSRYPTVLTWLVFRSINARDRLARRRIDRERAAHARSRA
jgi:GT2 family glycosyltransferase